MYQVATGTVILTFYHRQTIISIVAVNNFGHISAGKSLLSKTTYVGFRHIKKIIAEQDSGLAKEAARAEVWLLVQRAGYVRLAGSTRTGTDFSGIIPAKTCMLKLQAKHRKLP